MKNFLKIDKEVAIVLILFAISCISRIGLLIAMLCLLYYFSHGIEGSIKALMLIAIRTPMNTAIAVSVSSLQFLKWIILFAFCGYLFLNYRCVFQKYRGSVQKVTLSLFFFVFVAIFGSLLNASYPITAVFKLVSYFIVAEAIMIGIASSKEPKIYIHFFVQITLPIMIISFFTIGISGLRVINSSFQGLFNHPNMMGIMGAIFIGFYLLYRKYYKCGNILIIIMTLVMIYLAESRTGMAAACITLILGYKYLVSEKYRKHTLIIIAILVIGMAFSWGTISESMYNFVFKHDSVEILSSRMGQFENFQAKFLAHPLLGSGFAVPYDPSIRQFSLNMNLQVEPGNLAWAVIGDCGILGAFFFCLYLLCIIFSVNGFKRDKLILFVSPLIVSMGEMAFFSVNNIAILYYLMFALYMVNMDVIEDKRVEEKRR